MPSFIPPAIGALGFGGVNYPPLNQQNTTPRYRDPVTGQLVYGSWTAPTPTASMYSQPMNTGNLSNDVIVGTSGIVTPSVPAVTPAPTVPGTTPQSTTNLNLNLPQSQYNPIAAQSGFQDQGINPMRNKADTSRPVPPWQYMTRFFR